MFHRYELEVMLRALLNAVFDFSALFQICIEQLHNPCIHAFDCHVSPARRVLKTPCCLPSKVYEWLESFWKDTEVGRKLVEPVINTRP
ncbi:hypothetical protein VTK26DRAFT_669 [Humicola hyalothermophila]